MEYKSRGKRWEMGYHCGIVCEGDVYEHYNNGWRRLPVDQWVTYYEGKYNTTVYIFRLR
jgi:hypothetical protein